MIYVRVVVEKNIKSVAVNKKSNKFKKRVPIEFGARFVIVLLTKTEH